MELTLRKIADVIDEFYIDEGKAKEVARKLVEFIGSPQWERYQRTGDLHRLLASINCVITTAADDGHFFIALPRPGGEFSRLGVEKFTPNYIRISRFADASDEYVRMQYQRIFAQFADQIIIDLRDCPGGSPELFYFILCHLIPNGVPLFEMQTRHKEPQLFVSVSTIPFYVSHNTAQKYSGKVSVLVNVNTASAAEALTFVIKNKARGKVYGSRTSSDAHVQLGITVDNLIAYIPHARAVDPVTGKNWEGVGIEPDYDVVSKEYIELVFNRLSSNFLIAAPAEMYRPAHSTIFNNIFHAPPPGPVNPFKTIPHYM